LKLNPTGDVGLSANKQSSGSSLHQQPGKGIEMLILTRRIGEKLIVGGNVTVTVLSIRGNQIRMGIDAPPEIKVYREEIYQKIQAEQAEKQTSVLHDRKTSFLNERKISVSEDRETLVLNARRKIVGL
jgi:carbon storage regulator